MRALGGVIFFAVFFIIMLVTYAVPGLPPGKEVAGFLGINLTAIPSSEIPAPALLVGFFNGVVYGVTALLVFASATWITAVLNRDKDA